MSDDSISVGTRYTGKDGTQFRVNEIVGDAVECHFRFEPYGSWVSIWFRKTEFGEMVLKPNE
jgi:hypothetical protein